MENESKEKKTRSSDNKSKTRAAQSKKSGTSKKQATGGRAGGKKKPQSFDIPEGDAPVFSPVELDIDEGRAEREAIEALPRSDVFSLAVEDELTRDSEESEEEKAEYLRTMEEFRLSMRKIVGKDDVRRAPIIPKENAVEEAVDKDNGESDKNTADEEKSDGKAKADSKAKAEDEKKAHGKAKAEDEEKADGEAKAEGEENAEDEVKSDAEDADLPADGEKAREDASIIIGPSQDDEDEDIPIITYTKAEQEAISAKANEDAEKLKLEELEDGEEPVLLIKKAPDNSAFIKQIENEAEDSAEEKIESAEVALSVQDSDEKEAEEIEAEDEAAEGEDILSDESSDENNANSVDIIDIAFNFTPDSIDAELTDEDADEAQEAELVDITESIDSDEGEDEPLQLAMDIPEGQDAPLSENAEPAEISDEPVEKAYDPEKPRRIDSIFEFVELFVFTLVAVMVISTFFFRHSIVDGGSMMNTLQDGDRLIISDFLYEPDYDDIVVFEDYSTDVRKPLVKRVIGLEGDTITVEFNAGRYDVYRNGEKLDPDYVYIGGGGHVYDEGTWTVGEDEVFVMGDHRNDSKDSRSFGPVHEDTILGKVIIRIFPFKDGKFGKIE